MNKCYLFNNNGEYIGEYKLQIDQLETKKQGKNIYVGLPKNATFIPPIECEPGYIPVFNSKEWIKVKKEILNNNENIKKMTLEELKELKIKEIKDATGQYILSKYPLHTQTNIDNLALSYIEIDENGNINKVYYTEDDRNKKNIDIEEGRIKGLIFQAKVKDIQTIEELNNYQYNFNMEVK